MPSFTLEFKVDTIVAYTRSGCLKPSSNLNGIRFCASTAKARFVATAGIIGSRFPTGCLPRAADGKDGEPHLRARKANCSARCWATGVKNIKTLGWC